jgi:hypothetical protein
MIRGHKGVDWSQHLLPEDLVFLAEKISSSYWYPMATFERLGNAILCEVANNNMDAVRMWGRFSVDALRAVHPSLVESGDAIETLQRFRILRGSFFDFEALDVPMLHDGQARITIHYYMGAVAEEAASYQTMGFFERLLELAGADYVDASFLQRSWAGEPTTLLSLSWNMPGVA